MHRIPISICLKDQNNTFWAVDVRKGIEQEAILHPELKISMKIPSHDSPQNQINIIHQMIKAGPKVLIVAPSDPIKLIPILSKAFKKGIRLIIIDSDLDKAAATRVGLSYTFIGFDDFEGGIKTGDYIKHHLNKKDKVAVIQGLEKGTYTERVKGFCSSIKKSLSLTSIESADFDESKATTAAKKLLNQHQDLKAIFCTSDNMALGAITALSDMERRDVLVCGFDATMAGRFALSKGLLLTTVNTNPEHLGTLSVQAASRIVHHQKFPNRTSYPVELLTRERLRPLPKKIIQKRDYLILKPQKGTGEFAYEHLTESMICPIIISNGDYLEELPARLQKMQADKYIIVTDDIVKGLYGDSLLKALNDFGLTCLLEPIPAGERYKVFTTLNELANQILESGITKRSLIIVLGGGVVGNIAGLLSALLLRGIRFVHVPTTIMAQADSTTGGKQAVNTIHGKNLLGTFYEPEFIYINTRFISTLSEREYASGLAEIIKHGICQSKSLLHSLQHSIQYRDYQSILFKTIQAKIEILKRDPRESGEGAILVYGHTVGHALEIESNHKLNHGESISIGMIAAARISTLMGFAAKGLVERHNSLLKGYGLPTRIPKNIKIPSIIRRLSYDKKERYKKIPFVLLEDFHNLKTLNGSFTIEVPDNVIEEALKQGY